MKTTQQYLNEVKIKHKLRSDFALSLKLQIVPSAIGNYRKGLSRFGDDMAMKVAAALEIDPAEVLASMNVERTKSPAARETWTRMAKYFSTQAHKEEQTDLVA